VLLVGDAAGLVDPASGDGIYEAFVSARLAAEAIFESQVDAYESALAAALDRHAQASWAAKRALERSPRSCLWALRAPGVFEAVAGLLRGELAHPSEARRLALPPLWVIARLARSGEPA
jgi:flavin-dependent dehydrogenase